MDTELNDRSEDPLKSSSVSTMNGEMLGATAKSGLMNRELY